MKLSSHLIQEWQNQVGIAVLGTQRSGIAAQEESQQAFINKLSALSVISLAGKAMGESSVLGAEFSVMSEKFCSFTAGECLQEILNTAIEDMLTEWCEIAGSRGIVVRPEYLPEILAAASKYTGKDSRGVRQVLGKRGMWLAEQNPDWKSLFVDFEPEVSLWLTGSREQRIALLKYLRASEPARARELLEQTWSEEIPEDKSEFIGILAEGLTLSDEIFLEKALDDSRKPVRLAAVELLARMSDSGLCQRMSQRLKGLIKYQPAQKGLLKRKPAQIEIELPEIKDKELLRDGADPVKNGNLGQKASALANIIGCVPLVFWDEYSDDADEFIRTCNMSEFSLSFVVGLSIAAVRQQNKKWCEALIRNCYSDEKISRAVITCSIGVTELMSVFDNKEREGIVRAYIKNGTVEPAVLSNLLYSCKHRWSREFSSEVINFNARNFQQNGVFGDKNFMAMHLDPSTVGQIENSWPATLQVSSYSVKTNTDNIVMLLKFRQKYTEELLRGS